MPRSILYQAPQQNIAEPQTGMITRPWYMWFMDVLQTLTTAGDVFGPGTAVTDKAIVRWNGTSGILIENSVVPLSDNGTFSFPDGIRQTFNPNGTNAGVNVGAQAGDPSSLTNGDIWYNSTTNALRARINGVTVTLGADQDYVTASNGDATNPLPLNDGAGNFIYVPYTP